MTTNGWDQEDGLVKRLPHKPEDLSSIPSTQVRKSGMAQTLYRSRLDAVLMMRGSGHMPLSLTQKLCPTDNHSAIKNQFSPMKSLAVQTSLKASLMPGSRWRTQTQLHCILGGTVCLIVLCLGIFFLFILQIFCLYIMIYYLAFMGLLCV